MCKGLQVAIDGPASAGKSTVAKLVAKGLIISIVILVQCIGQLH